MYSYYEPFYQSEFPQYRHRRCRYVSRRASWDCPRWRSRRHTPRPGPVSPSYSSVSPWSRWDPANLDSKEKSNHQFIENPKVCQFYLFYWYPLLFHVWMTSWSESMEDMIIKTLHFILLQFQFLYIHIIMFFILGVKKNWENEHTYFWNGDHFWNVTGAFHKFWTMESPVCVNLYLNSRCVLGLCVKWGYIITFSRLRGCMSTHQFSCAPGPCWRGSSLQWWGTPCTAQVRCQAAQGGLWLRNNRVIK